MPTTSLNASLGLGKYVLHKIGWSAQNQLSNEGLMILFSPRRVLQGYLNSLSRSHTRTPSTQLRSTVIYILCQYDLVSQRLRLIFNIIDFPRLTLQMHIHSSLFNSPSKASRMILLRGSRILSRLKRGSLMEQRLSFRWANSYIVNDKWSTPCDCDFRTKQM
jgi:hypothetical protein